MVAESANKKEESLQYSETHDRTLVTIIFHEYQRVN